MKMTSIKTQLVEEFKKRPLETVLKLREKHDDETSSPSEDIVEKILFLINDIRTLRRIEREIGSIWDQVLVNARIKDIQIRKIAKGAARAYFKEHPKSADGVWCFWLVKHLPKYESGIQYKGQWFMATYQIGRGYEFTASYQNGKIEWVSYNDEVL